MYGTVETDEERLEHMLRLRDLQDETGGFHGVHHLELSAGAYGALGPEATGVDYLRTLAVARIVLDNFDNLQASWVTQGGKVGQLSLAYGANDMGSVMIEENVVRAAGASYCMDEVEMCATSRTLDSRPSAAACTTTSSAIRFSRTRCAADARALDSPRSRRHPRSSGVVANQWDDAKVLPGGRLRAGIVISSSGNVGVGRLRGLSRARASAAHRVRGKSESPRMSCSAC